MEEVIRKGEEVCAKILFKTKQNTHTHDSFPRNPRLWTDVCSHLVGQNRVIWLPLTARDAGYFFILVMFYFGTLLDVQKSS